MSYQLSKLMGVKISLHGELQETLNGSQQGSFSRCVNTER